MLIYPGEYIFPFTTTSYKITFLILIMIQFSPILYSKREAWLNRIKREAFVKSEISNNNQPSVYNISAALDLPAGVVTEEVLSICANVKSIELGLPVPKSENVTAFSEQVGPENSTKKVAGCYYIYSPNHPELGTYVGHSIHLGKRVKDHAKGVQTSTGKLVQTAGSKAVVLVYIPDASLLPAHITMAQFVLILEQYLFFLLKPTINRAFVASPGYSNPDMDNSKHIEKMGKDLHIYWLNNDTYYHLHSLSNLSALSHLMNKGRKWAATIIDRGGFYHHQLFLSKTILENATPLPVSETQLIEFINWLGLQPSITSPFCVEVTNVIDNTKTYCKSAASAAKDIGCDVSSISVNRTNPLKGKYYFKYIDVMEYVKHTQVPPFSYLKVK